MNRLVAGIDCDQNFLFFSSYTVQFYYQFCSQSNMMLFSVTFNYDQKTAAVGKSFQPSSKILCDIQTNVAVA